MWEDELDVGDEALEVDNTVVPAVTRVTQSVEEENGACGGLSGLDDDGITILEFSHVACLVMGKSRGSGSKW
jgi:hypothetical protein